MTKKCIGCGIELQVNDKDALGFTPKIENDYCMRCFRLKNYGEKKEGKNIDTNSLLKRIDDNALKVFLIDYFNITKEIINVFKTMSKPKILVMSKSDLLRLDMKKEKIKLWLEKIYGIKEEIFFISNNIKFNSFNLLKYMDKEGINKAYLLGITNSGKSTFINRLLKENGVNKEVVASSMKNTTQELINLKIDKYTIIDTPGFSYNNLGKYLLNKEIKPITFNIKAGTTIVIDNKLECYFKDNNTVVLYLQTNDIKRKYNNSTKGNIVIVNNNSDLVIPGLGYINIKESCEVLINFDNAEVRLNLSGVEYE